MQAYDHLVCAGNHSENCIDCVHMSAAYWIQTDVILSMCMQLHLAENRQLRNRVQNRRVNHSAMRSRAALHSAGFPVNTDESCNADLESSRWGKSSPGCLAGDSIGHCCGQQLDAAEDGSKLQHRLLHDRILKGGVQV